MVSGLEACGAKVRNVVAYRTVPDAASCGPVAEALKHREVGWLTFTSSSTVKNFLAGVPVETVRQSRAKIASIGPTTSETLRGLGLAPTVEAEPHTIPALVEAILGHKA
jgi:uroporphyrinogen III methyltransferase/synthase